MNRYTVAALALLSFTACERRIDQLGGDVCPDGYFHALGELCASNTWFTAGPALLFVGFAIFATLRMFSFMANVEARLAEIKAALRDRKD